jgi:molybdate transport system substrate-binding protein
MTDEARQTRKMKKIHKVIVLWIGIMAAAAGCTGNEEARREHPGEGVKLTVSAAASTQDALNEIRDKFEKKHPSIEIVYNFGGSGALQKQIEQGAPIDLFFSAAEDKFAEVRRNGLIDEQFSTNLVGNELVLIVPKSSKNGVKSFGDLPKATRLSIGTPQSVPAGRYAQQTLEHLGIWRIAEEKIIYAKDVRQVLTYVETGNVDAGMVYRTDALMSEETRMIQAAEPDHHDPIVYPLGVIKKTKYPREAALFYEYLTGQASLEVLEKYGFQRIQEEK